MGKINTMKVILGGLVAGLVMNVIDYIVNMPMLGARWMSETNALHLANPPSAGMSAMGWIISDLLLGWLALWVYAGIRPRFGPGPATAIKAGLTVWAISSIAYSSFCFMGLYSHALVVQCALGGLVAKVVGTWVGAMIYSEQA